MKNIITKYNITLPVLLIVFILLISCKKNISTGLDMDLNVLNEILPDIQNHIPFYKLHPSTPPPPRPVFSDQGEIIKFDTIELKKQLKVYNEKVKKIEQNLDNINIAIFDTLIGNLMDYIDSTFIKMVDSDYGEVIKSMIDNPKKPLKIDLAKITDTQKFIYRYYSEFPKGEKIFEEDYTFNFAGILTFSRIYFNDKNNKAILYCSYNCGRNCATGNLLFLELSKNIWTIKKTDTIWIS